MTLPTLAAPAVLDWAAAACREDPALFYPDRGAPSAPAKEICGACHLRAACLNWALENDERFGIWGGLSVRERREELKRRREVADDQARQAAADEAGQGDGVAEVAA